MSETWNKIEKRCPNGYHKDEKTGQCVDANGNQYQAKQEQPKQEKKPKKTKEEKVKDFFKDMELDDEEYPYILDSSYHGIPKGTPVVRNRETDDIYLFYKDKWRKVKQNEIYRVREKLAGIPDYDYKNRKFTDVDEPNEEGEKKSAKKMKKSRKTKNVNKSDISALFDDLEDAVYNWDEGWIDNVMDANYAQAHGEPEEACKYLEDMYDNCHNSRVASLCERIFDRLGCSQYIASAKKSKNIKKYDNGFTHSELQSLCPHATKIWDELSIDVIWDLPSGNHPGIFISDHGPLDAPVYVCWMTAYQYLDFKEPNTPDGELPRQFAELADRIESRVKQGQRFEDTDKLPTKEEVCDWLREMDRLCAEQAEATSMKSTKKSYTPDYHDFRMMVSKMRTTGDNRQVFKE